MAESEFSIEIPVSLTLTQARAELRQFLEEASRGVSVPLRGGGAPGTAPQSAAESVAVAEQRAVATAMDRAQTQATGRAPQAFIARADEGGIVERNRGVLDMFRDMIEGPAMAPRTPRGASAAIAMSRAREISSDPATTLEHVYPGMGTPVSERFAGQRSRIENMQAQLAQARAMQAETAGMPWPIPPGRPPIPFPPGSRPAPSAPYPVPPGIPGVPPSAPYPPGPPAPGPVPPDPVPPYPVPPGIPLPAPPYPVPPYPVPPGPGPFPVPPTAPASRAARASAWLGANTGRGLLALLGAHEINNAIGAIRGADVAEQFARTPEEAFLARAEANVQATSGLYGGTLALPFNLLNTPNSPQRMLREAQAAVEIRSIRDQTRQGRNETAANVAYRNGYGVGGRSQAEISRIEAQRTGQVSTIKQEMTDLQNRLDARTPITETAYHTYGGPGGVIRGGGENVLTGDARLAVQQQLKERTDRLADINAQAKFDTEQKKREEATFLRQSTAAESTSRMTARGATSRALERQALSDQYTEARAKAVDLFGAAGGARVDRERAAAFSALEFGYGRSDEDTRHALNLATQVQLLQSSNQPVAAAITAAVGQASLQTRQVFRNGTGGTLAGVGGMLQSLRAIGGNLAANVAAPLIQERQNVYQQQQGIVGQAAVLQMQLDRNPLGAQIAGIAAQRDAYLNSQQFQSLSPAAQGRLRPIVQGYAELQERYARQQDRDRRFEIGDSLDAANRQSRLRQAGGDYRVDAVLDRIVTDTARDARQLERDRDPENAVRRRTLGVNQLREARGDYFRSINFEEVSGGRIAASRDGRSGFDNVERKFREAEDRIGKSKDGGPDGGGVPTSGQMQTLIGLVQQFVNKNFLARTGP